MRIYLCKSTIIIGFLCVLLMGVTTVATASVRHHLEITLEPDKHLLIGTDRIEIPAQHREALVFDLAPHATDVQVRLGDQPARFSFKQGRLRVDLPPNRQNQSSLVTVDYRVVFNDPVPVMPVNTDNPGYGVAGTIQPQGTFLLAGAGWYPQMEGADVAFNLRITAPAGIVAVTAGKSLGHETQGGRTVSVWQIDRSVRGLALSAAPYRVQERQVDDIVVATYFLPRNAFLAESYLEASIEYLKRYENLFGPYPFPKFAVVENFFPTGFGFPSYTLIGGRVLRLPFIIRTSLGHEIAHCWWGNGVLVDYTQGNWSEALTTYCADYLYKEDASPEDARDHRRQMLRNFATLVDQQNAMPLNRFQSRHSPATRAIGYDKGAMVFHMLRQLLGEEAFWSALREIYRDFLFTPIGWQTFQKVFEKHGQMDLDVFFKQWLTREGAPRLALEKISAERQGSEWITTGYVIQNRPFYDIHTDLKLHTEETAQTAGIKISGSRTPFTLRSRTAPVKLALDPGVNIFRKLDDSEIPPSVNSVKGAADVAVVLAEGLDSATRRAAQTLVRGLGINPDRIIEEQKASEAMLKAHNLILVGYSGNIALHVKGDKIKLEPDGVVVGDVRYGAPDDAFFGVFRHPMVPDRLAALFWPRAAAHAEMTARKITHYGKYSYLAFQGGRNVLKGIWPVVASPVVYRWSEKTNQN